jgi:hypothetical protein
MADDARGPKQTVTRKDPLVTLVTRFGCALGVGLMSAVLSAGQATPSGALTLQTLFGSLALDIAEPGAEFQRTDVVVKPNLPTRRMVAAGCSTDHYCLVYYERGGLAHTWHVVLFRWRPAETRFEWGGSAPANLRTIDEVRKAVVSGAVKTGQAAF